VKRHHASIGLLNCADTIQSLMLRWIQVGRYRLRLLVGPRLGGVDRSQARRGKRHQLAGLLAIAGVAVLGGARGYSAIAEFARDLPAATLAQLGVWRRPCSTCSVAPSEPTLRRTSNRSGTAPSRSHDYDVAWRI
jgi:hypothetical protein